MSEMIEKRYAKVLFDQTLQGDILDNINHDVAFVLKVMELTPAFEAFIKNPLMDAATLNEVLETAFQKSLHETLRQFLHFLINKNRLSLLKNILFAFQNMVDEHKEVLRVKIASPIELSQTQIKNIEHRLKDKFQKKIETTFFIDPSLLGGFKIYVGDQIYDSSIANYLGKFKRSVIHA